MRSDKLLTLCSTNKGELKIPFSDKDLRIGVFGIRGTGKSLLLEEITKNIDRDHSGYKNITSLSLDNHSEGYRVWDDLLCSKDLTRYIKCVLVARNFKQSIFLAGQDIAKMPIQILHNLTHIILFKSYRNLDLLKAFGVKREEIIKIKDLKKNEVFIFSITESFTLIKKIKKEKLERGFIKIKLGSVIKP